MYFHPHSCPRSLLLSVDLKGMEDIPLVCESIRSLSGKRQEDNSGRSQKTKGVGDIPGEALWLGSIATKQNLAEGYRIRFRLLLWSQVGGKVTWLSVDDGNHRARVRPGGGSRSRGCGSSSLGCSRWSGDRRCSRWSGDCGCSRWGGDCSVKV
jgi:hypothetical protein